LSAVVYHRLNAMIGYWMRVAIARTAFVLFLDTLTATAAGGLTVRRG
jgi:hypothetical protein